MKVPGASRQVSRPLVFSHAPHRCLGGPESVPVRIEAIR